MSETQRLSTSHQLILQERGTLEMTGISDLSAFDDTVVIVTTSMGDLTVRGHGLNVRHLDLESGMLSLTGKIEAMTYSESMKGGWLSRLLR